MKYKAKPAIETLFVRIGDGLAAATTLVGVHFLAWSTQSFFVVNVALVLRLAGARRRRRPRAPAAGRWQGRPCRGRPLGGP